MSILIRRRLLGDDPMVGVVPVPPPAPPPPDAAAVYVGLQIAFGVNAPKDFETEYIDGLDGQDFGSSLI